MDALEEAAADDELRRQPEQRQRLGGGVEHLAVRRHADHHRIERPVEPRGLDAGIAAAPLLGERGRSHRHRRRIEDRHQPLPGRRHGHRRPRRHPWRDERGRDDRHGAGRKADEHGPPAAPHPARLEGEGRHQRCHRRAAAAGGQRQRGRHQRGGHRQQCGCAIAARRGDQHDRGEGNPEHAEDQSQHQRRPGAEEQRLRERARDEEGCREKHPDQPRLACAHRDLAHRRVDQPGAPGGKAG